MNIYGRFFTELCFAIGTFFFLIIEPAKFSSSRKTTVNLRPVRWRISKLRFTTFSIIHASISRYSFGPQNHANLTTFRAQISRNEWLGRRKTEGLSRIIALTQLHKIKGFLIRKLLVITMDDVRDSIRVKHQAKSSNARIPKYSVITFFLFYSGLCDTLLM